ALPDASPDAAQDKALHAAANLLQSALQKSTGAKLPGAAEGTRPAGAPATYLGKTRAAKQAGLPPDDISGWPTPHAVRGQNLVLIGHDGTSAVKDSRFVYQGPTRAVASFLETLGVRFLLPGQENGTSIPQLNRWLFRRT